MASQSQFEPRILLAGVQELDRLARLFRRRLRDAAVELLGETGDSVHIGPEAVLEAVPLACQKLLADLGSDCGDERGSDGSTQEAA
jgi:hypothetical protein